MNKPARHYAIKQLVTTRVIPSQDELRLELQRRKFRVTQATLSRDLAELGISRVMLESGPRYVIQTAAAEVRTLRPVVGKQVISIRHNEDLVVIKTLPGSAGTVAEFIDVQGCADIMGTVAGDNTLLVVPASTRKTPRVVRFLTNILTEGKEETPA